MTKSGNFEREHTTYLISQNKICISQGPEGTSKRSEVFLDNFTQPEASCARTFFNSKWSLQYCNNDDDEDDETDNDGNHEDNTNTISNC